MNIPRLKEIYEKNGLQREIIGLNRRSDVPQDVDVIWQRPDGPREFIIWLPYWYKWVKGANLVT